MLISFTEAGKLVDMTKAGLIKAAKKGHMSASKNEKGEWMVDPAELERAYPKRSTVVSTQKTEVGAGVDTEINRLEAELKAAREQLTFLKERLAVADEQNDKLMKSLENQIVVVRQLTDQTGSNSVPAPVEAPKQGFLKRLFG